MRTFKYEVNLVVEIEAFDQIDAEEAVRDAFGLGESCGVDIVESEIGNLIV